MRTLIFIAGGAALARYVALPWLARRDAHELPTWLGNAAEGLATESYGPTALAVGGAAGFLLSRWI